MRGRDKKTKAYDKLRKDDVFERNVDEAGRVVPQTGISGREHGAGAGETTGASDIDRVSGGEVWH